MAPVTIQWVDFFRESDFARLRNAVVQALGNGEPRLARGIDQRTETAPAPLTDEFISITDAVEHIGVQSKWGKGKELEHLSFEAAGELDQAAYDGRIEIRGMQEERTSLGMPRLLRRIPAEYWENHQIDVIRCMDPSSEGGATKHRRLSSDDLAVTKYDTLRVRRSSVEALWPK